jgi:hypothetical protein
MGIKISQLTPKGSNLASTDFRKVINWLLNRKGEHFDNG